MRKYKELVWLGDSLKNVKEFPEEVKEMIGYSLYKVQQGLNPANAKILKTIKPTVLEIVANHNTNTYRAVYTAKVNEVIYVLHCFQKKSKWKIKTPRKEIDLIKQRLREAIEISQDKR